MDADYYEMGGSNQFSPAELRQGPNFEPGELEILMYGVDKNGNRSTDEYGPRIRNRQ